MLIAVSGGATFLANAPKNTPDFIMSSYFLFRYVFSLSSSLFQCDSFLFLAHICLFFLSFFSLLSVISTVLIMRWDYISSYLMVMAVVVVLIVGVAVLKPVFIAE